MKKLLPIMWCTLIPLGLFAQANRDFKPFYKDGKEQFKQGQLSDAIVNFKEALRLEPKAQRYKVEGTFFDNYLPRYMLALCYERSDVMEAARWASESKTASESSIIRKRDRARATYNDDIERIEKGAETHLAKLNAQYNLDLQQAQTLLSQKKFEDARSAFQKLYASNPNRPEASVGLGQVDAEKKNYLRQLELDFQQALINKDFSSAEGKIAQLTSVDSAYANLSSLQTKLRDARTAAAKPPVTKPVDVIAEKQPDPKPKEPVVVADNRPRDQRPVRDTTPTGPSKTQQAQQKSALRTDLLATLRAYRRGDPAAALQQLEQIESPLLETSGSYHWLRGLYLLSSNHYAGEDNDAVLQQAHDAMSKVAALVAQFEPDPKLYPEFVLSFYRSVKENSAN